MLLKLPFKTFLNTIKEDKGLDKTIYYEIQGDKTILTLANFKNNCTLQCSTGFKLSEIKNELTAKGYTLSEGRWFDTSQDNERMLGYWITVITYPTQSETPGIWIDINYHKPETMESLKKMYDEFIQSGDLKGVSFDQFNTHPGFHIMNLPSEKLLGLLENNNDPSN